MMDPGQHVVHQLSRGEARGSTSSSPRRLVLTTGDGAAVTAERAVSLTARGETEILLIDLDGQPSFPRSEDIQMNRPPCMNSPRWPVPDAPRSRLRATVATTEHETAGLKGQVTDDDRGSRPDGLAAACADRVEQLALDRVEG